MGELSCDISSHRSFAGLLMTKFSFNNALSFKGNLTVLASQAPSALRDMIMRYVLQTGDGECNKNENRTRTTSVLNWSWVSCEPLCSLIC